jgi:hypothetical protein
MNESLKLTVATSYVVVGNHYAEECITSMHS